MQVFKANGSQQGVQRYGAEATVDIAVYPPNASVNNFHWRVGLATVENDGLFPRYRGVDRSLALLEGGALAMAFDGAHKRRVEPGAQLAFDGEATTFGCPLGGPVLDLSVMSRRQYCQHRMHWLEWEGDVVLRREPGAVGLLFVVDGEVTVEGQPALQARDALLLNANASAFVAFSSAGKARGWWVEFLPVQ